MIHILTTVIALECNPGPSPLLLNDKPLAPAVVTSAEFAVELPTHGKGFTTQRSTWCQPFRVVSA